MEADEVKEVTDGMWTSLWFKILDVVLVTVAITIFGLALFRITCVDFVDNYEIAYKYDRRTGTIEKLNRTGYIVTPPFLVNVHSIDGRPMQVCISAVQRVLNCKLVEFDPQGLELFVQWHGRDNYSNDEGSRESPTKFNQIMMAYAYDGSGKSYPFLHVIRELKSEEISPSSILPR